MVDVTVIGFEVCFSAKLAELAKRGKRTKAVNEGETKDAISPEEHAKILKVLNRTT